jgi:effector-binding domain-containing protein
MYHLKLGVVLGTLGATAMGARAADVTPPTAAPEIVLKHTDPARVVFLEHTGPYWTVGPLFKQVREAMAEHNESGPMFARYLADPTVVLAESLRTEVGFVTRGDWIPEPPLKSAQRDGEQVVSLVVEGSYGTTTQSYSLMHDWVSTNGFEAVGPVIESYPSPLRGAPSGAYRTEIQIPVRRASSAVSVTPEPKVEVEFPRIADETLTQSEGDDSAATASMEPLYPIKDLVDSSRFDRVAEQLVPTDRAMPVGMQVWAGQVVFRISAVAKGIEQTYPGGSPEATALSEAIVRRYRQASASSKIDPLAQAVVRVDTHLDPQSAQKRLIVRDLDNLLGQVALKTIDAKSALDRLSDLLQRVQDVTNITPIHKKQ